EKVKEYSARNSLGVLYSIVTLHLGFDFNSDEYKIMGLAPYGDPNRFRPFFEEGVQLHDESIRIPILALNRTRDERENYLASRQYLTDHLIKERRPADDVAAAHADVASALQACLERAVVHICGYYRRKLGLRRLALAGGVALNCTANGKLLGSG